jgi:hypothetical protein
MTQYHAIASQFFAASGRVQQMLAEKDPSTHSVKAAQNLACLARLEASKAQPVAIAEMLRNGVAYSAVNVWLDGRCELVQDSQTPNVAQTTAWQHSWSLKFAGSELLHSLLYCRTGGPEQGCWVVAEPETFYPDLLRLGVMRPKDQVITMEGVQRWGVLDGTSEPVDNEATYDMRVTLRGGSISLEVAAAGLLSDRESGLIALEDDPRSKLPQINIGVEINGGAPCVHVHQGLDGELLESFFAVPGGRTLVRPGDSADHLFEVPDFYMPDAEDMAASFAVAKEEMSDLANSSRQTSSDRGG